MRSAAPGKKAASPNPTPEFLTLRESEQRYLGLLDRSQAHQRTEFSARLKGLTSREREVLDLLIAYVLGISSRTVDIHRGHVMEKMEADSLAELMHMMRELES